MSAPEDRYCSDCAWPYECAAGGTCFRREAGAIRSPYEARERQAPATDFDALTSDPSSATWFDCAHHAADELALAEGGSPERDLLCGSTSLTMRGSDSPEPAPCEATADTGAIKHG